MDLLGLTFLPAGLALFGAAWWAYGKRRAIADTPTSKVRSMAIGPVELVGNATSAPGHDLLRAPFTHEPCVYWEYQVEEQRTRVQKGKTQTYWATVASDRAKLPFGLRDETGVARVDPEGADLPTSLDARFGSGWGRDPPQAILDFLAKKSLSHEGFFGFSKTMRYTERRLPEGVKLYVLGNVDRPEGATGEGNAALVVRRQGDGAFLVSTSSEKQLLRNWTLGFWALLLIGIGAAGFGAYRLGGGGA